MSYGVEDKDMAHALAYPRHQYVKFARLHIRHSLALPTKSTVISAWLMTKYEDQLSALFLLDPFGNLAVGQVSPVALWL